MFTVVGAALAKAGTWLFKNPAIFMTGIICVMFVMVVISKNSEIGTLNKASKEKDVRIETLITSLGQARANVATLNGTLTTQSDSIAALKTQGDAAGTKFDQLIASMASANATTARKLAMLDKAKPGPDKCASAFQLIRESVK